MQVSEQHFSHGTNKGVRVTIEWHKSGNGRDVSNWAIIEVKIS